MEKLKRINELWHEIDVKESELADLMAEFEGEEVECKGKKGVVIYIDPPNEVAKVDYIDGENELVDFKDIKLI
ncbi:hypothetical protein [Sporosarcina sp. FSL K6-2383]|uniref:hypothetical protein n=1 Tax=Sporosarcina sp. FSL K6-2383 TaxID=2921556 RepID=UPI00315A5F88